MTDTSATPLRRPHPPAHTDDANVVAINGRAPVSCVAVVGCGYWGINHVRVLTEIDQVTDVIACDADEDRLGAIRERFPTVRTVRSPEEVAEDEYIEAAIVCTPATTHLDVARPLLESGKHLLVEKPITVTVTDALDMIDSARSAGATLAIGHTYLFNANVREMRGRIDSGAVGDVHYLYARRSNLGPIRHDVNALWDLAPHDVSMFNHLVDTPPSWVTAVGSRLLGNQRHDVGFVTVGYANGVIANIHVSWADPYKVREFVIVGTQERLHFDDTDPIRPLKVFGNGVRGPRPGESAPYVVRDRGMVPVEVAVSEPLKSQTLDFLACVETGRPPTSDGEVGLRVVEVMEAIDASIAEGGAPVDVAHHSIGGLGSVTAAAEDG